ncbi:FecR domain-containing protein [Methylosinus sp. H3A]|uniref:FecR family protein n=1 Tax=Methylosinus sp. H3A TaxID=2785786 RepID=UPI0018C34B97|nr:FecR domain-containing protein [Methylosinus sp. H3A]MBG0811556.1 FecR domain-containing protein [Methylosinus sp. H3A]
MTGRPKDDHGSDDSIDAQDAAVIWWVRRDAGRLSAAESAAFEAWLADPANAAAFDEICALCGDVRALKRRHVTAPAPSPRRRRLAVAAALAASLAAMASFDDLRLLWSADFRTATGETLVVGLPDGSKVQLGAKSALAVNYAAGKRELTLLEGEAFFDVATDAARPFVVAAAGGTVTALGTAFDIALEETGARVTVAEHKVSVASRGERTLVEEGRQSGFGPVAPTSAPVAVAVQDATAWRRGKLIFVDRPLGEVVDILARYHRGYVLIPSAAVRKLRVTGVFDAADPIGALRAIESSLDLDAIHLGDYLVVLRG